MDAALHNSLRIVISKDKLRAHLAIRDCDPKEITAENIELKLRESGIPITEALTARVTEIVTAAQSGKLPPEPVLVTEGRAPVAAVPASFKLVNADSEDGPDEEGRVDFRESNIQTVKAGEPIGALTPEVPAVSGVDVCGCPIPGEKPKTVFQLGSNVKLGTDGKTVLATAAGKLQLTTQSVAVVEVVEINGDIDYGSGNVDSPTDILIRGTIRDTFTVRSEKSISIKGAVEAAEVQAGTSIHIGGGIAGRGSARIVAGGEIRAKYCEEAYIEAGGDVTITRQIMNSRVQSGGMLVVDRGAVVGGFAYARDGAQIKNLGNEANIRTEIAIGVNPRVLAEALRIDQMVKKKKEAAAKIRNTVQPLLAQLKRLTREQREKATELMYEADQMDAEVAEQEKKKQESLGANCPPPGSSPTLLVTKMIYPGVVIVFGNKMALVTKERRGPIKIQRRLVERTEEIVVIDQISGSVIPLPSCEYVMEAEPEAVPTKT